MFLECLLLSASLSGAASGPAPEARRVVPAHTEESVRANTLLNGEVPIRIDKALRKRSWRRDKAFLVLSAGAYGMALLDITNTARAGRVGRDYIERDPLARPFVRYPVVHYTSGIAAITGANWLSWRMKNSRHWRRLWWLPQVTAMSLNAWGYASSSKHW